jgi:plasmid replication initiation protein
VTDQLDIFRACYTDIPIRDQRDLMERPFFSLAKTPRKQPIDYDVGGVRVRVTPNSDYGIATIWDADVLIWAATQITEAMDRGGETSPRIQFHPYSLLKAIRRSPSGENYKRLLDALRRLNSTYVETNIRNSRRKVAGFTWISTWETLEDKDGKPIGMSMTLPDWLYEGIRQGGGVLSIHEDYFLLKGGIERWLYRVARKHAGQQEGGWHFTMRQLYEKSGSTARFSDFALDVRKAAKANALPEYCLRIDKNGKGEEITHMIRRNFLSVMDANYEAPRSIRRRQGGGIKAKAIRFA